MSKTAVLQGLKILVVDDEEALRQIITLSLKKRGAEVSEARNGSLAMDILKTHRYDFVISDIRMPGGDGIQLSNQVAGLPEPRPKVILMTGHVDVPNQEAIKMMALGVLRKPFSRDALLDLIMKNRG
ncbi:MAG TPA: response regulator [Bdellovibrionales bacterium]|nr:response regulator [Bdellovibrionales bacterium]